ncbi:hypothetical protein LX32DRAFT_96191 [Colletotrichum zoysiae]|uniref:Uncharacterized protein n=1 Tax=Colletotrichum zoysiae TaxID=1216348 RepID=A0AAD9H9E0_9PEZI|nr:hypothetical protein LX32DRAFT_96191 [Colletotrichum zoysiae]
MPCHAWPRSTLVCMQTDLVLSSPLCGPVPGSFVNLVKVRTIIIITLQYTVSSVRIDRKEKKNPRPARTPSLSFTGSAQVSPSSFFSPSPPSTDRPPWSKKTLHSYYFYPLPSPTPCLFPPSLAADITTRRCLSDRTLTYLINNYLHTRCFHPLISQPSLNQAPNTYEPT